MRQSTRLLGFFVSLCMWPLAAYGGSYEIWVANQGLDKIQIIDGDSLAVTAEIDVDADGKPATSKPHMVLFSPDFQYAYVANVGSLPQTNNILVISTTNRKIIATLPAGPVTHAVTPSPNGNLALATSVGSDTLYEVVVDSAKGTFTLGRKIPVGDGPGGVKDRPICALFSADSKKAYVTNGGDPAAVDPRATGSISVVNLSAGTQSKQLIDIGQEACGLALSKDGNKLYINIGGYVNSYLVIDTASDEVIMQGLTAGFDSHGSRVTPDGNEFWMINRQSNSIVIVDTGTDAPVARIEAVGDRPDLLDFSPDGARAFATLRGQAVTKTIHDVSGSEPGVAVYDVKGRTRIRHIPLAGDPHGIAVRPK